MRWAPLGSRRDLHLKKHFRYFQERKALGERLGAPSIMVIITLSTALFQGDDKCLATDGYGPRKQGSGGVSKSIKDRQDFSLLARARYPPFCRFFPPPREQHNR